MKKISLFLFIVSLLVFSHCENSTDENHCQFLPIVGEPDILGKWQVYEEGYSPGGSYRIKKVPSKPTQLVEFKADNVVVSNVLGGYSFYYLLHNPTTGENIVALFETQQNSEEIEMEDLDVSYSLRQCENGNISLSFRFCIEGCHLGLKRI